MGYPTYPSEQLSASAAVVPVANAGEVTDVALLCDRRSGAWHSYSFVVAAAALKLLLLLRHLLSSQHLAASVIVNTTMNNRESAAHVHVNTALTIIIITIITMAAYVSDESVVSYISSKNQILNLRNEQTNKDVMFSYIPYALQTLQLH